MGIGCKAVGYHSFDYYVGYEVAFFNERLGLFAKFGASSYLAAEKFAGRDVFEIISLYHRGGVSPFTGSRRAEYDEILHMIVILIHIYP